MAKLLNLASREDPFNVGLLVYHSQFLFTIKMLEVISYLNIFLLYKGERKIHCSPFVHYFNANVVLFSVTGSVCNLGA